MPEYHRVKFKINRLTTYYLRRLRKYGTVCKVLHANPEFIDKTPDTDLVYFTLYTLNKHRRWEMLDNISDSFMSNLQTFNPDMDILLFDRYFVDSFRAHISYCMSHFLHNLDGAKIKTYWQKNKDEEDYKKRSFRGVGRWYGTDTKKEKGETTTMQVVSYNVIRGPKNYVKYFAEDFRGYPKERIPGYVKKSKFDPMTTFFDWREFDRNEDVDYYDDYNYEDDDVEIEEDATPSEFYDFSNHFVISRKTRKLQKFARDTGFVLV